MREADRDRYLATLFAPAEQRDALFALYAFNVEIARVRDLAREPMPGEIRLQWWREALSGEREGEAAAHPVAAALRETLARYGLLATPLLELIDAHTLRSLRRADGDARRSGTLRHPDAIAAVRDGGRHPRRRQAPAELFTLDASVAYAIAGLLTSFGAARGAPAALRAARCAAPASGRAERYFRRRASAPLLAALAEMRELARRASWRRRKRN